MAMQRHELISFPFRISFSPCPQKHPRTPNQIPCCLCRLRTFRMGARRRATRPSHRPRAPWSRSGASRCARAEPSAATCPRSTPCTGVASQGTNYLFFFFHFRRPCRTPARPLATRVCSRPRPMSSPWAGSTCAVGAPCADTWPRSMPCTGPRTPGSIFVKGATVRNSFSLFSLSLYFVSKFQTK